MIISAKKVNGATIVKEINVGVNASDERPDKTDISNVSIQGITLEELSGVESKCAELQVDFAEGDELFVISSSKFVNNRVELSDVMYVIKEEALEDFTARLIKNAAPPE